MKTSIQEQEIKMNTTEFSKLIFCFVHQFDFQYWKNNLN